MSREAAESWRRAHAILLEASNGKIAELTKERDAARALLVARPNISKCEAEELTKERDEARAEVERWERLSLSSSVKEWFEKERGYKKLLAEAEAALEGWRRYIGWDHIDAIPKPPSRQERLRVTEELLAKLRGTKEIE